MSDIPYIDKMGNKYVYGDFLPIELSYFGYNDSVANDLYQMDKNGIKNNHYVLQENNHKDIINGAIDSISLPDSIYDTNDDILEKVLISKNTKRHYKITQDEFNFYKKHSIPIPRESFYERYSKRFKLATSFKLYKSKSSKSGIDILTSYNPNDNQIVWSIEEYKKNFE